MGKRAAALFVTVIVMFLNMNIRVFADDYKKYDDFDYMINLDGNVEIVGYEGKESDIKIPAKIDGMAVKVISKDAFRGNEDMKTVYIPEGISKIDEGTFADCIHLEKVTGAENVLNIKSNAFDNTALLKGEGLVYIGKCCYKYVGEMAENAAVDIKKETIGIAENAFKNCGNLKKINFEGSKYDWDSINIELQGNEAFLKADVYFRETGEELCSNETFRYFVNSEKEITVVKAVTESYPEKTKIVFPSKIENKNVVGIEDGAFENCSGLSEISFENGIRTVGERAFADCSDLRFVSLPEGLESIGKDAFKNTSLYNSISGNIFYIGKWCLGYKDELPENKDLKIQRTTEGIAANAFYNINALNVFFPESIKYINQNAFGNSRIHGIFFEGSHNEWSKIVIGSGNEILDDEMISFNTTIEKSEEYIYKDLCVALFFVIAFLVIALFWCISRMTVQRNEIVRLTAVNDRLKKRKPPAKPSVKPSVKPANKPKG